MNLPTSVEERVKEGQREAILGASYVRSGTGTAEHIRPMTRIVPGEPLPPSRC